MAVSLTFEECMKQGIGYSVVPVCKEILNDMVTPLAFLMRIKEGNKRCFLLESADGDGNQGRYTFLGYQPSMRLRAGDEGVAVTQLEGQTGIDREVKETEEIIVYTEDMNGILRRIFKEYRAPQMTNLPPFTGGLVGYFSYDYISSHEPILTFKAKDVLGLPYYDVMLFDSVIAFDRLKQKLFLISNVVVADGRIGYDKALRKIAEMEQFLMETKPQLTLEKVKMGEFTSNFSKEEFEKNVETAKEYIKNGDVFQVVLSQRFSAPYEGSLISAYRALRNINPSEYMFYLLNEEVEIAGASPETLVKIENRHIMNLPIAGTRRRGATPAEDEALEKELLADEKELAEHTMLVDLGRNDVGRVSAFGSVHVSRLMKIARFSHVMHIVSQVEGDLAEDKDAIDALGAILPAGTLSGAPKIRACEIIDELEPSRRGFYGGGLGYIDFAGSMDTCITIRSIIKKDGTIHIQSGGGIVADSVPENEYYESMNKAMAMMKAIETVKEGD